MHVINQYSHLWTGKKRIPKIETVKTLFGLVEDSAGLYLEKLKLKYFWTKHNPVLYLLKYSSQPTAYLNFVFHGTKEQDFHQHAFG